MGLAAAYYALQARPRGRRCWRPTPRPAAWPRISTSAGLSIERFYHFVCKADAPTFALMQELGIGDKMRWRETSMGYYVDGPLHPWGDPVSLPQFPIYRPSRSFATGC